MKTTEKAIKNIIKDGHAVNLTQKNADEIRATIRENGDRFIITIATARGSCGLTGFLAVGDQSKKLYAATGAVAFNWWG